MKILFLTNHLRGDDAMVYFVGGTPEDIKKFKIQKQPYGEQAAKFMWSVTDLE